MTGGTRACFISASGQNAFFGELQDALRTHLAAVGIQTETSVDRFPPPADDLVYLVVAHEYIPLTLPRSHPSEAQLRRTVVIATEQPGTPWFEEGVAVSKRATVTVDINP